MIIYLNEFSQITMLLQDKMEKLSRYQEVIKFDSIILLDHCTDLNLFYQVFNSLSLMEQENYYHPQLLQLVTNFDFFKELNECCKLIL